MEALKLFDLYKEYVTFGIGKASLYKSVLGGIIWILIFSGVVSLFTYFGLDCFLKTNPSIVQENLDYLNSTPYYLDNNNFIFSFTLYFEDKNGKFISFSDDRTRFLNITGNFIDLNGNYFQLNFTRDIININNSIENSLILADPDPQYSSGNIFFDVSVCTECNITEAREFISNTTINVYILTNKYSVIPSNLTSPVSLDFYPIKTVLNKDMMKNLLLFYKNISVIRDTGWLFNSIDKFTGIDLVQQQNDVTNITKNSGIDNSLLSVSIYLTRSETKIKVTYLKIQQVLAQVGGIITSITTLLNIIISIYYENKISNYMVNSIFIVKNFENSKTIKISRFQKNQKKTNLNYISQNDNIRVASKNDLITSPPNLNFNTRIMGEVLIHNNKNIYEFGLYDKFLIFLKCCLSEERRHDNYLFLKCLEDIKGKLDVANYLKLLDNFDCLLKFMLTTDQYRYFHVPRKSNALKKLSETLINDKKCNTKNNFKKINENQHPPTYQDKKLLKILGY